MKNELESVVYSMLVENTGRALGDSGGAYGRNWEKNASKTLADFQNEPSVSFDIDGAKDSGDIDYRISVFHYLTGGALQIDELCESFNKANAKAKDWEGNTYGVSKKAQVWLDKKHFVLGDEFNTYNGESCLSQVLQGTYCMQEGSSDCYVLLQVHGGCDVRGGYTDARLFLLTEEYLPSENVTGEINEVRVSNYYNSYTLRCDEDDSELYEEVVPLKGDGTDVIILEADEY